MIFISDTSDRIPDTNQVLTGIRDPASGISVICTQNITVMPMLIFL
jgi:hypothetical protein